jgi:hypothetical protein
LHLGSTFVDGNLGREPCGTEPHRQRPFGKLRFYPSPSNGVISAEQEICFEVFKVMLNLEVGVNYIQVFMGGAISKLT